MVRLPEKLAPPVENTELFGCAIIQPMKASPTERVARPASLAEARRPASNHECEPDSEEKPAGARF